MSAGKSPKSTLLTLTVLEIVLGVDNVIFISTNPNPAEGEVVENEPAQMDATYLAVNLAYLPEDKKATFNMDTSKDDYGRPKALV